MHKLKASLWRGSPSARTTVPAIKEAYFLCLVNEKSFKFNSLQGGGGAGLKYYKYCEITSLQGI